MREIPHDGAMQAPGILWQVHRRPPPRMLGFSAALGVVLAIASTALIHALMLEPAWGIAAGWGTALGASLVLWMAAGSSLRLTAEGTLIYALRGTDCAAIEGRQVRDVIPVRTGVLAGLGLCCAPEAVTFLNRKGFTAHDMQEWQRHLGVTVVAEFMTPADVSMLKMHLEALPGSLLTARPQ